MHAYRQGIFPMALEDGQIGWFSPDPRGIIPLDHVHVPSRLARVIRSGRFEVTVDRDFEGVMRACAADREDGTWISDEIIESYTALHHLGAAHSVEAWHGGQLAGGLYGVHLGGAFFGESMFHHETDASKVALIGLVSRMRERGLSLLDVQWVTPHLAHRRGRDLARGVSSAPEQGTRRAGELRLRSNSLVHRVRFTQREGRDRGVERLRVIAVHRHGSHLISALH
jgi:leucyl/phenylalanyl-tRNA---protein transferase